MLFLFSPFQQSYKCLVFSGKSGYICIEFDWFLLLSSNTSLKIWGMSEMAHIWVSFSSHLTNLQALVRHNFYTNNLLLSVYVVAHIYNWVDYLHHVQLVIHIPYLQQSQIFLMVFHSQWCFTLSLFLHIYFFLVVIPLCSSQKTHHFCIIICHGIESLGFCFLFGVLCINYPPSGSDPLFYPFLEAFVNFIEEWM